MPDVPPPEGLTNDRDIRLAMIDRIPDRFRANFLRPRMVEIRPVSPRSWLDPVKQAPFQNSWFRVVAPIPDDPALHRAVLAYADCLSQAGGRVPTAVFDKLRTFWNDEQIFEFTYITCLYDMHAVITRALRMEYDNRDEPIVEIAAPEGFNAADFLSAARPAAKPST